ncbi:hypothetical protein FRB98_001918, partial [Tulasnella sp. 332]
MPSKRIRRRPAPATSSPEAPLPISEFKPSDLTVKDTAHKGKGVFTSVAIAQGTRIISEEPLITSLIEVRTEAQRAQARAMIARCSEDGWRKVMAFGYSPACANLDPVARIMRTNSIPIADGDRVALFETICRINHDCRPNAQYFWNKDLGKEVLNAMEDIAAGEEITVSYSGVLDRQERRAKLLYNFGFDCRCPSCSLPPKELAESDQRIAELSKIIAATPMLLHVNPVLGIAQIKHSFVIIEQERLWRSAGAQAYDGLQTCSAWSDLPNAKVWAGRAADAWSRTRGPDSEDVANMRALAQDPRSHR